MFSLILFVVIQLILELQCDDLCCYMYEFCYYYGMLVYDVVTHHKLMQSLCLCSSLFELL